MRFSNQKRGVALAAAIATIISLPATDATAQDDDVIEEVIVTGVPRGGATKLEASVSVSSMPAEEMINFAPRSTAEIFRSLPGIRAESSGGGGNANMTIR